MTRQQKQKIINALYTIEPRTKEISCLIVDLESDLNFVDIPSMKIHMDDVRNNGYKCEDKDLEEIAQKMTDAIMDDWNERLENVLYYGDYERLTEDEIAELNKVD